MSFLRVKSANGPLGRLLSLNWTQTGVTWEEQETNGHQEHGRPGPLSWHMKHGVSTSNISGKLQQKQLTCPCLQLLCRGLQITINSSVTATKHRTQRSILQSLSPWWAREAPDKGGKEINENVPKQGLEHDRTHQRNPPTLVLWTSLKNPNGLTLAEQGTGLLQGFSWEREAPAGRFSGRQCSPA